MSDPWLSAARLAEERPLLMGAYCLNAAARVTDYHQHARGQLLGALHGLLSVGTVAGQWVVPATHAVWVPPHQAHALRSHGRFSGWSVYVAESACASLPSQPKILAASGVLRETVARAVHWPEQGVLDEPKMHLAAVILDEIRDLPAVSLGLPWPQNSRLRRVARALLADLADKRRLADWAAVAGVSPRTLSRRFLAETGFPFGEWRQRARVLRALERLAAGDAVTAIALDLGYDSVSAFIAMFRRVLGVTPARYFA